MGWNPHVHGMYVGNWGQHTVSPAGQNGEAAGPQNIETLIILSATHFLQAKSELLTLSAKLEAEAVNGVGFPDLQSRIDNALYEIQWSRYYYGILVTQLETANYNPDAIECLKKMNYTEIRIRYNIAPQTMNKVESFLSTGNIYGAYNQLYKDATTIAGMLNAIRYDLYAGRFPKIETIWTVNQTANHMQLFGQTMAQVFYNLPMVKK